MSRYEILTKKQRRMAYALLASGALSVTTQRLLHYVNDDHRKIACERLVALGIARIDFGNLICVVPEEERTVIIQDIQQEAEKTVSLRRFL